MRYYALIMVVLFSFTILNAQDSENEQEAIRPRSLLFELGGGFAAISYDETHDSDIEELLDPVNNWDRITVPVHIGFGISVFERDYITCGVDGIMDRLWKGKSYSQLNTVLYYLGYKFYPFRTGIYFEPRAGISHIILDYDGDRDFYDMKPGASLSVAYDFAMHETGISAALGLKGLICIADNEIVEDKLLTAGSIFVSLLFK